MTARRGADPQQRPKGHTAVSPCCGACLGYPGITSPRMLDFFLAGHATCRTYRKMIPRGDIVRPLMRFPAALKAVCSAISCMAASAVLLPPPFSFIAILALAGPCSAALILLRAERRGGYC